MSFDSLISKMRKIIGNNVNMDIHIDESMSIWICLRKRRKIPKEEPPPPQPTQPERLTDNNKNGAATSSATSSATNHQTELKPDPQNTNTTAKEASGSNTEQTISNTETAKHDSENTFQNTNNIANDEGKKTDLDIKMNSTVDNSLTETEADLTPDTIGGHLQQVFALLQFSQRQYIDPTPFINSLGLDAAQQQDAQEFSKLFLSLLEENLSHQENPSVRNLVQRQCLGLYQYVTKCSHCQSESKRSSEFYELDLSIRGHKNLNESIEEFLKVEKLEGDNQYMCGTCNSKQNAVRYIQLDTLPNVLNLQLLRFVFDRNTGHKKKLNSFLEFPESIDVSKYMQKPEGSVVYDLQAVLIHRGPSAYSGHYIAHIKAAGDDEDANGDGGTWYKFNDEEIEKMGGKNLQLGSEEDIEGKGGKKPKTGKGHHASRNAYMLVYINRNAKAAAAPVSVSVEDLPVRLQQFLALDDHKFEEWIKDMKKTRDLNVEKGHGRQTEVKDLYNMCYLPTADAEFDFLPSSWISKWMTSDYAEKVPEICTKELLCAHNNVNPDKVANAKCVAAAAADILYAKYAKDDSCRLRSFTMCQQCVTERCRVIRTKARMEEDHRAISAALKSKDSLIGVADCYWVGKASLRSWKRLAMEKLQEKEHKAKTNGNTAQSPEKSPIEKDEKVEKSDATETSGADATVLERIGFNEDLLCIDHDELALDEGCRRLVTGDIWKRLYSYFPTAPQYAAEASVCVKCQEAVRAEHLAKEHSKQLAAEQKAALPNLYHDRNRPHCANANTSALYIVSADFLDEWRKFIREPNRRDPVVEIWNASFLCSEHRGFLYQPDTIGIDPAAQRLSFLWAEEWEKLESSMIVDCPIKVEKDTTEDGNLKVTPVVCETCCTERMKAEHELRLQYKNATIYVRQLTEGHALAVTGGENGSRNGKNEEEEEYIGDTGKRKKGAHETSPPEKLARVDIRRSSRHRKLRGEKQVTVSATDTLRDLKVQIMKQFSVAPFDQNLSLDGATLTGEANSTLASLNILPGCTIYLKADEPTEDPGFIEDISSVSHTEEGFKGTGLVGIR